MKIHSSKYVFRNYALGSLGVLCGVTLLASCDKKEGKTGDVPEAPKRELKVATADERAAALSLLKLVPADAQSVMAVYDLPYLVSALEQSNLGKMFIKEQGLDNGESLSSQCPVKELVIVGGPGQLGFTKAFFKDMGLVYSSLGNLGLGSPILNGEPNPEMILKLLPQLTLLDQFDLSPGSGCAPLMIMTELTSDAMMQVKMTLNQGMGMIGMMSQGMAAPYSAKIGTTEYTGISIDGKMLSQMMQQMPLEQQGIDAATVKKLADNLAKGKLYIVVGYKGDVLVTAICTNPEKQLALAATPADSILGKKDVDFADQYLAKKASFACYVTPAYVACMKDGVKEYYKGEQASMKLAFSSMAQQMGADSAKAAELGEKIAPIYDSAIKMLDVMDESKSATAYGWYDNGLKTEFVSGIKGVYNWDSPVAYGAVCDMPDAVVTCGVSLTQDYVDMYTKYMDQAVDLISSMADVVSANDKSMSGDNLKEFAEVKGEVLKLWDIAKGLQPAFGQQYAMALDLKGKGYESKEAKDKIITLPRVAWAISLKDRSKLAPAWDQALPVINGMLAKIDDGKVQLGAPLAEQKDGLDSYSYACPVLAPEDYPGVALNDNLYVFGSSKSFNYEVAKAAKPAPVPAGVYGPMAAYMKINIAPIIPAAKDWQKMAGKGDFDVVMLLEALAKDIKAMTYTVSKEEGDKVIGRFNVEAGK